MVYWNTDGVVPYHSILIQLIILKWKNAISDYLFIMFNGHDMLLATSTMTIS
jgi:hypothetical protein